MKRRYKTRAEKRRKWYHDDDLIKGLFLVAGLIVLTVLYCLTIYACVIT